MERRANKAWCVLKSHRLLAICQANRRKASPVLVPRRTIGAGGSGRHAQRAGPSAM